MDRCQLCDKRALICRSVSFECVKLKTMLFVCVCVGHCWTGALQDNHHSILQGGHGLHSHVWHHQRGVLQRCPRLVRNALVSTSVYLKVAASQPTILLNFLQLLCVSWTQCTHQLNFWDLGFLGLVTFCSQRCNHTGSQENQTCFQIRPQCNPVI